MYQFKPITEAQITKSKDSFQLATDSIFRAANWAFIPGNSILELYFENTGEWHYKDTLGVERIYVANPSGLANLKQEVFFANRVPIFSISYAYNAYNRRTNRSTWLGREWGYYDINLDDLPALPPTVPPVNTIGDLLNLNDGLLQIQNNQINTTTIITGDGI